MRKATLAAYLGLAAAAAIAAGAVRNDEPDRAAIATEVRGSFSFANSREAMPVFTATNIGPGDSAEGTVEITNEGSEAIAVTLAKRDLLDTPGSGGGILSQRLVLRISGPASASSIYEGPLATMQPLSLGRLGPGTSRRYEFVATLPESGITSAGENALQSASTSVAYSWTTQAAPEDPSPATPNGSGLPLVSSPSPAATKLPLAVRIVGYRNTLRNGRLIVWARCNQACRVKSSARFLGQGHAARLRPTARHAQRRRFGARTRRLSLPMPGDLHRLLSSAKPRVRIVVIARNRDGNSAKASKLLHLKQSAR